MSSPAVKPPVHPRPIGYDLEMLELLGVVERPTTQYYLESVGAGALTEFEKEALRAINAHNAASTNTLSGEIMLMCQRHQISHIPLVVMRRLHERFPYTPWKEIFRAYGTES